jgi:hypothetical protein
LFGTVARAGTNAYWGPDAVPLAPSIESAVMFWTMVVVVVVEVAAAAAARALLAALMAAFVLSYRSEIFA